MGHRRPEDNAIARRIDENIRRIYEEPLSEDVPDRFRELLDRLSRRETSERRTDET